MPRLIWLVLLVAITVASMRLEAAPIAPAATGRAHQASAMLRAQYIYLGKPYCWYHYGWAGPGWYLCGYGTRAGFGWGGSYGWNAWELPRTYRALPAMPRYRYRDYD
jgi:hypothetical protein